MGIKREFNFEDDMELLNLKYQFNNENLLDYFQNEAGANELIQQMPDKIRRAKKAVIK